MTTLAKLTVASLAALHNTIVADYAPEGFGAVDSFKSRAKAITAIEAICAAGNVAITFDGDNAVIVDTMQADDGVTGDDGEGYGPNDDDEADKARMIAEGGSEDGEGGDDEAPEGDDEGGDDEGEAPALATLGADGKGKVRAWGVVTAGEDWLKANPRGGEAREAYRKERRKAARLNRKAERKAKDAAQANV